MGKLTCVVALFIFLINLGFGGVSGEKACNGTLGNCFSYGGDLEFSGVEEAGDLLRHYAGGARWLLQANGKTGNRALQTRGKTCPTDKYANCLVKDGKTIIRPCLPYERCRVL